MLILFEEHNIACPPLAEYCQFRDAVLAKICTELGIDRDMAKKCCLTVTHIGNYTQHTGGVKTDFLELFKAAYTAAVKQLKKRASYVPIWERACRDAGDNPLGTFVSYCCQIAEASAIKALATFLRSRNGTIRTNSFDGLMASGFESLTDAEMRLLLDEVCTCRLPVTR